MRRVLWGVLWVTAALVFMEAPCLAEPDGSASGEVGVVEEAEGRAPELTQAQLGWIAQGVKVSNGEVRLRLAHALEASLGERLKPGQVAERVRAAIPESFQYQRVKGRVVEARAYRDDRTKVPYSVVLPEDYDPARRWPVHVHLHGGGFVSFRACRRFFSLEQVRGFILVCPMTARAHWWEPEGEEAVMKVLREVTRRFNVDSDRVSIGGGSSGGTGTWHLGHKYAARWSALVPRCAGRIRQERYITNIMQTPVFMIHGGDDGVIPVTLSQEMAALLSSRGKEFTYREVAGRGHEFFSDLNAEVLPWLLTQRRVLPRRFGFEPTGGFNHGLIHWLELWPTASMRASLQQGPAGTRVEVTAQGSPERLRVYLRDEWVDLDKPVTVIFNGRQVFVGLAQPRVETVLETFHRTHDLGRTFTAVIDLRL